MGLLFASLPNPFYDRLARFTLGLASCSFETSLLDARNPRDVLVMGAVNSQNTIRWLIHETTGWKRAETARVELMRKLITVQDDERRKLARDLHDNVGQLLTGMSLALGAVEKDAALSKNTVRALALVREAAAELRQVVHDICHGLRAGLLEEVGLYAALKQLVAEWGIREPTIAVAFLGESLLDARLPREVSAIAYALVQEALTNVFRHAAARRTCVLGELASNFLTITIQDDGRGFDAGLAAHQSGLGRLGLVGMRERVALVGGTLNIDTAPGEGTNVVAEIPVPDPETMFDESDSSAAEDAVEEAETVKTS
jgi:signal transduction histidine kinase